ncbi:purine-binding chemotaxis protein CheW [Microvirga lupini]|uniref:Purine-binding chemotaxis protein CheW n=1 Tax=Microvirga lupini TaxID=420324 RepID=A0A7W4VNC2_9HYPH|nr:chemotaxis protein CheW [Microvirga lupini]MBB3020308.1 purine-binding chemotaxis protein CheW [Microvirga lupini]
MARSVRRKLRQIDRGRIRSAEERVQHILDERTESLASRRKDKASPAQVLPRALVCGSGRERFGIPIEAVAEVLPPQKVMPVPDGPPAMVGLFGRGGRLVSVIDLALALGIESFGEGEDQHFILLRRDQPQVALRVERAYAVADIRLLTGEEATGFRTDAVIGYARLQDAAGDPADTLSLLDPERLLRPFLSTSPVPGV